MKKHIELVVKILIYATFLVPLIVIPSSFIFPFIVPKILIFRSLVTAMLAGYILLLIINWQEYKPKLTILNIVLAAFLLSFAISTFVGTDAYHSFWDNHERMLGLFTIFHYVAYYFVCTAVFKNWKDWQMALRIFLIAGTLVAIIGLLQVGNPYLLLNQGGTRVASTLGNSIYLGGYGLFLSFVAFLLIIREKYTIWRLAEGFLGLLAVLAMFYSGTRGSMLGLVAGVGVLLVGYVIVLREHPKTRLIIGGIILAGIVLLGILYTYRQTNFVSSIPAVGRSLNTSLTSLKNSPRWIAWEIAIDSFKQRPIFGWGPNNFFYAFNDNYNPRSLEFGYGETWFDNAHNIIVNTLAVQGIFGLVVYLSIFVLSILVLWKTFYHQGINKHLVVAGAAFLVAHLVQNVTVFENPTSYLYFMFWLAMINQLTIASPKFLEKNSGVDEYKTANRADNKNGRKDQEIGYWAFSTVSALTLLLIFIFNIQPARANMKTLEALRMISSEYPSLGVEPMKEALAFSSPHIDDIRADIGRTVGQIINSSYQKLGLDKSKEILDIAYNALSENLTLHPLDIRNQLTIAQLAQTKAILENNANYLLEAEKFLEDALKKSPKRQQIIYNLSSIKLQVNKQTEAVQLMEQTIKDNYKIAESYWRLAYTYKAIGQSQKAKETIDLAYKNNIQFSDNEKEIIKQILTTATTTK